MRLEADRSPSYSSSGSASTPRTVIPWISSPRLSSSGRESSGKEGRYTTRSEEGTREGRGLRSPRGSGSVRSKKSGGSSRAGTPYQSQYQHQVARQCSESPIYTPTAPLVIRKKTIASSTPRTPYQSVRQYSGAPVPVYIPTAPLVVRFAEQQIHRSPIPSPTPIQQNPRMEDFAAGPPTPVDDSPYIRFAIDQLTRNEELLLRNSQSTNASTGSVAYNVERRVPDYGLGAPFTSTAEKEREALALVRKHRSLPAGKRGGGGLFAFNPTRPLSAEDEKVDGEGKGTMRRKLLSDCEACVPQDGEVPVNDIRQRERFMGLRTRTIIALACAGFLVVAAAIFCAVYFTRRR